MDDLLMGRAVDIAAAIASRDVSSEEVLNATFARVDRLNPDINAVIWQDRDAALDAARACDADLARGEVRGPLHGVPITVKESFDLAGSPTTWGIPDWAKNIVDTDSDAVARYRAAGGVVYGKTNVPLKLVEWQTFNEIYGTTSNPWDQTRTPGGSSGGSAAALACGMSALEVGSDIGSSIRNPAHYCGLFGLKPTWNVVSMQGHLPTGWYGDIDIGVGGPLARSAVDLTLAYNTIKGPGRFEASHWGLHQPDDSRTKVSEFRVALMLGDDASPVDADYLSALSSFADKLEAAGATVIRDQLPDVDSEAHFTLYLKLLGAALSFGMSDEDVAEVLSQFKDQPADIIRIGGTRYSGMDLSHREWLALDNDRRIARLAFDAFFEDVDVILAPVCASAAFLKDEVGPRWKRRIPVNGQNQLEVMQLFWSGYSGVVGLPSVVGPMDQIDGLPVGYQAITGHGRDQTALAFARAVEQEIVGFTASPLALNA
jgi:amidase